MKFTTYPEWFSSCIKNRRLVFSKEENPKLDFEYILAGKIEVGETTLSNEEIIFLLLQK
jgi:hypothetical protein